MDYARKIAEFCRKHARERLWLVFMIAGVILLGHVVWAYSSMYFEQRHLAREWQLQQQQHQSQLATTSATTSTTASEDAAPDLTLLSVPKINLESVVLEGTDNRSLRLGPGHLTDTPEPGQDGNAVISGHRDTFFRHLNDLQMGDDVLVQRGGKTFHYKVTGKRVVEPTDMAVIAPTKDSELTLLTCYPTYYIGPAPKRLVVFTKLVDEAQQTAAK